MSRFPDIAKELRRQSEARAISPAASRPAESRAARTPEARALQSGGGARPLGRKERLAAHARDHARFARRRARRRRLRGGGNARARQSAFQVPAARPHADRDAARAAAVVRVFIDLPPASPSPKRGDLLQTNVGDRRERTWFILRSRRSPRREWRFHLWAERWWQIEPDLRMRLFRSAERNGGQGLLALYRYRRHPVKFHSR